MRYHFITVLKSEGLGFDQLDFIKCTHFTSNSANRTITYKDERGVWRRYQLGVEDKYSVITRTEYPHAAW